MAGEAKSVSTETVGVVEQLFEGSDVGRAFLDGLMQTRRDEDLVRIFASLERLEAHTGSARQEGRIDTLGDELKTMLEAINQTRSEISAIQPDDESSHRIMAATEELDAITTATERATSDILGAAERIQVTTQGLREAGIDDRICSMFDDQATNIFMACSFQDITGQRVQKVVNLLRYLEQRINDMVKIWPTEMEEGLKAGIADLQFNPNDTRPDAHLLNGPSVNGEGVSQDDIDKMLNGDSEPETAPEPAPEPTPEPEVEAPVEAAAEVEAPAPAPEPEPTPEPVAKAAPAPEPAPAPAPEPVVEAAPESAPEPVAKAAPEPAPAPAPEPTPEPAPAPTAEAEPEEDHSDLDGEKEMSQDDLDALFG